MTILYFCDCGENQNMMSFSYHSERGGNKLNLFRNINGW